ncbi:MAG: DNA primase [Planctomycetota bacterium]
MDRFEDAKLRILEGTDLVALVESYMPLKQRGRNFVALCPFHAESSPSFTVDREKQFFRCYGCGKYGDAFTWLMERDGLTFREAMEQLADQVGVSLEGAFKSGRSDSAAKTQKARTAYEALAQVADWLHRQLLAPEGELARNYLDQRGLSEAMAPWLLGYHPAAGEDRRAGALTAFAREQQLPFEVLEQAGLIKNGREMFAGRLIFPIVDERGRTVAFGGRIVPGAPGSEQRPGSDYKPPKYLNSPESPFFHKRRVLYGLRAAKQAAERRLVVMEGYTDVIACHLAGFTGAVASLGTAFTSEHARTVERYADQGLVLMFDGDRAGKQAAERAQRELVNSRLDVRIAMVGSTSSTASNEPAPKDPADIVLPRPGEDEELVIERRARFADLLDGAQDSLTIWFRLLRQRLDLTQAVHVETAARECAALLELVEVQVRRDALVNEMARHLDVPAQSLRQLVRKPRGGDGAQAGGSSATFEQMESELGLMRRDDSFGGRSGKGKYGGGKFGRGNKGGGKFGKKGGGKYGGGKNSDRKFGDRSSGGGGGGASFPQPDFVPDVPVDEEMLTDFGVPDGMSEAASVAGPSVAGASSSANPMDGAGAEQPEAKSTVDRAGSESFAAGAAAGSGSAPARSVGKNVPTESQRVEFQMLACVLARPELLARFDPAETPLEHAGMQQLFEWAVEGIAMGRDGSSELFRYLFTRAADQPRLRALLAKANERGERMSEPEHVFAGTLEGRQRKVDKADRRSLREQYLHAVRSGDRERAAELQEQMQQQLRRAHRLGDEGAEAAQAMPKRGGGIPSFLVPGSGVIAGDLAAAEDDGGERKPAASPAPPPPDS